MTTGPQISTGSEGEKSPREIALETIRKVETPTSVDGVVRSLALVLDKLKEGFEGESPRNPVIKESLDLIGGIRQGVNSDYENEVYVEVAGDKDKAIAAKLEERLEELVLYYEIVREEAEALLNEGDTLVNKARVKLMLSKYQPGADADAAVVVLPENSTLNLEKERQIFEGKVQEHFKVTLNTSLELEKNNLKKCSKEVEKLRGSRDVRSTREYSDKVTCERRVEQLEKYVELYDRVLGPMMAKEVVDRFESYVLAKYEDSDRKIEVLRTVYGGESDPRKDDYSNSFKRKTVGFNGFKAGNFKLGKADDNYCFGIFINKDKDGQIDLDLANDWLYYFRELDKGLYVLINSLCKGTGYSSLVGPEVVKAHEVTLGFIQRAFVETGRGVEHQYVHEYDDRRSIAVELDGSNDSLRAFGGDLRYIAMMDLIDATCVELGINAKQIKGYKKRDQRLVERSMSAEGVRLNVQTRDEFQALYDSLGKAIEEGYGEEEVILTLGRALEEISRLRGERDQVLDSLEGALGITREELDGALGEVGVLEARVDGLVEEKDGFKKRAAAAEEELKRTYKENSSLEKENGDLKNENARLEQEVKAMKKELELYKRAMEEARTSLSEGMSSMFGKKDKMKEADRALEAALRIGSGIIDLSTE